MSVLKDNSITELEECKIYIRPVRDVVELLGGKWKLPILTLLSFKPHRFKEIENEIAGINPKMLSKDLKELEEHGVVNRTSLDTFPPTVEYSLTPYGKTLDDILVKMRNWGTAHREKIVKG